MSMLSNIYSAGRGGGIAALSPPPDPARAQHGSIVEACVAAGVPSMAPAMILAGATPDAAKAAIAAAIARAGSAAAVEAQATWSKAISRINASMPPGAVAGE